MLTLPPGTRVFLAISRVDGRKGINGLSALVRSQFAQDPLCGAMFVFFTKRRALGNYATRGPAFASPFLASGYASVTCDRDPARWVSHSAYETPLRFKSPFTRSRQRGILP